MDFIKYKQKSGKTLNKPVSSKVALMCPKCFKYIFIDNIIGNITCSIPENMKVHLDLSFIKSCSDCLEKMVEIDANIIESIVEFNKLGWKTKFCCGGHLDKFSFRSYIQFHMDKNTKESYLVEKLINIINNLNLEELKYYKYTIKVGNSYDIDSEVDICLELNINKSIDDVNQSEYKTIFSYINTIYMAIVNELKKEEGQL